MGYQWDINGYDWILMGLLMGLLMGYIYIIVMILIENHMFNHIPYCCKFFERGIFYLPQDDHTSK